MVAFLFPGQGSHYRGMGRGLLAQPWAGSLVEEAEEATGMPWRDLPELTDVELARTAVAQPAILVVEWLAWAALTRAGLRPTAVAGHSLGEFAALAAARVLPWPEALRLVTLRGRLMEEAAAAHPGGMVAALGIPAEAAAEIAEMAGCHVANYNAPGQTVLSGRPDALDRAAALIHAHGGRALALPVAGAFHSPHMAEAEARLAEALARAEFAPPAVPFVSGTSGAVEDDPERIRSLLERQMTSPVVWTTVMEALPTLGVVEAVEAGPGEVLTRLGRRCTSRVRFRALAEVIGDV